MDEMGTNPFKKAGVVLLVIGIIDLGVMIYCITNKISYSSSFNIFSVIAGIFLLRADVKAARIVRWLSAFFVSAFVAVLVGTPFTTPLELLSATIRENPAGFIGSFLFGVAFIAVLVWVHLQLSSPEALAKLAGAGYKTTKPKYAYGSGLLVLIFMVCLSFWLQNSESGLRAKTLAQEQLGPEYKYHVTNLSVSATASRALVIAYTANETKNVAVKW